jgi:CHASE1-domain containing sensor protein
MNNAVANLNFWGPAVLICFSLLVGLFYQNSRINDLKDNFNNRIDLLTNNVNNRIDLLTNNVNNRIDLLTSNFNNRTDLLTNNFNNRIDDLKTYLASEFKRVDERIDRLESPLVRK